jgi:glycosyltransferase involved in cell wall biosynthesis
MAEEAPGYVERRGQRKITYSAMPTHHLFFSIIIPAHNEEKYIAETLRHIRDLEYPKERYEAIVVENGSTEKTLAVAKEFHGENIHVFSSEIKGVSAAKNLGIGKSAAHSDWTIFLDADTLLKKDFLKDLNAFLGANHFKNHSVGTTRVHPLSRTIASHFWFRFYNIGHRLTKTSYSIQLIKSALLKAIRFDETLSMGEDLELIKNGLKHGAFLYFKTDDVYTSTRRFEDVGWLKLFFSWNYVALLPKKLKRKHSYKVIR